MTRGLKVHNEYVDVIDEYANTPKAVYAAIALSFALRIAEGEGDDDGTSDVFERAAALVASEWRALHAAGIVEQSPRSTRSKIARRIA
jgi:hypothetical protein